MYTYCLFTMCKPFTRYKKKNDIAHSDWILLPSALWQRTNGRDRADFLWPRLDLSAKITIASFHNYTSTHIFWLQTTKAGHELEVHVITITTTFTTTTTIITTIFGFCLTGLFFNFLGNCWNRVFTERMPFLSLNLQLHWMNGWQQQLHNNKTQTNCFG